MWCEKDARLSEALLQFFRYLSCLKDLALLLALLLLSVLELIAPVAMQRRILTFFKLQSQKYRLWFHKILPVWKNILGNLECMSVKNSVRQWWKNKRSYCLQTVGLSACVSICTFWERMTPASATNSSVGKSSCKWQPQSSYLLLVRCLEVSKAITSDESISSAFRLPSSSPGSQYSVITSNSPMPSEAHCVHWQHFCYAAASELEMQNSLEEHWAALSRVVIV